MAGITAAMVKELRERTGAGMMECKKALVEVEGDIEAAIDVLRTHGLAAVAKKAGRATNEGVIATYVDDAASVGVLLEVNCETDFVARNDKFLDFAQKLAATVAETNPTDIEDFKNKTVAGESETVEAALTEVIHTIGENTQLTRFARIEVKGSGAVASYVHAGGRIGVLVEFGFTKAETASNDQFKGFARDVAMQVAAATPMFTTRDEADADVVAHELEIYKAQAAESGKPEAIQEKMATGRLEKFYKENALVEQPFVKNPDQSVSAYAAETSKAIGDEITILGFDRFSLGETAE